MNPDKLKPFKIDLEILEHIEMFIELKNKGLITPEQYHLICRFYSGVKMC